MQDLEIADLHRISELIYERYRYDFRNYALSSFKRRVARILEVKKLSVTSLLDKLKETPPFINEFIDELTINVTEMFRDPGSWRVLRQTVIPEIRKRRKQFKIWHAGCSSGEEVVTMCILLHEMGILRDAHITATDIDENMLEKAKRLAYPMKHMKVNEKNYADSRPWNTSLENYYIEDDGLAIFKRELIDQVSFVHHDLVTGPVFDSFDLILCRNVMIYFNQTLKNDVLLKFHNSLNEGGYLSVGSKESVMWCEQGSEFGVISNDEKVYQKRKR